MKILTFVKKKIIEILFGAAVFLLAANLLTAKFLKPSKINRNLENITPAQINTIFIDDLNAFALHSDWIKKIKSNAGSGVNYNYRVDLPKDLPIPVVLKEIYEHFYNKNVAIKTLEKVIGGKTELKIFINDNLKLNAVFNYNDNLKREGENIGLVIDGLDKQKVSMINFLIRFPQTYAALLVPSKFSVQLADTMVNYRKEYAVLLNDNINEMDYKLRGNFSPARLKSALRTIIGSYPKAIFYVIDDHSKLYNSAAYYLIKEQLKLRNILLIKMSEFKQVSGGGSAELETDFARLVKDKSKTEYNFILIPADDFVNLQPQIFSFIKIGYKFKNPSLILTANDRDGKKN